MSCRPLPLTLSLALALLASGAVVHANPVDVAVVRDCPECPEMVVVPAERTGWARRTDIRTKGQYTR